MRFQIPLDLARKHPALTAADRQMIRNHVDATRKKNPKMIETDVYRIAFQEFLIEKGISI